MTRTVFIIMLFIAGCGRPPEAVLTEAHQTQGTAAFSHAQFDKVLQTYVDANGDVDYAGLSRDTGDLDQYITALDSAPFDQLGRDDKLALLINAYNAFTLRLILDHYPLRSIRDIPAAKRWDAVRWNIAGHTYSLSQIEHEEIRGKFREPRIHFAVNCASVGCPPLRRESYVADRLDEQLDEQMRHTHTRDRWLRLDMANKTVYLTKLYDWYGGDFTQVSDSVLAYVAGYNDRLKAAGPVKVQWLDYDWSLNAQARP